MLREFAAHNSGSTCYRGTSSRRRAWSGWMTSEVPWVTGPDFEAARTYEQAGYDGVWFPPDRRRSRGVRDLRRERAVAGSQRFLMTTTAPSSSSMMPSTSSRSMPAAISRPESLVRPGPVRSHCNSVRPAGGGTGGDPRHRQLGLIRPGAPEVVDLALGVGHHNRRRPQLATPCPLPSLGRDRGDAPRDGCL